MLNKNIVLFAAAVGVCLSGFVAQADVTTYGTKYKLTKVSQAKLGKNQRAMYSDFRKKNGYFGAFYINTEEDNAYWVRNFHVLENAKASAFKGCHLISDSQKTPCVLYALTLPKGMDVNTRKASGLGLRAFKFRDGKFNKRQKAGKYGAFAINGGSNYGSSWGHEDSAEAKATALSYCQVGAAKTMATLNIEGRAWAKKRGYAKCRVVVLKQGE